MPKDITAAAHAHAYEAHRRPPAATGRNHPAPKVRVIPRPGLPSGAVTIVQRHPNPAQDPNRCRVRSPAARQTGRRPRGAQARRTSQGGSHAPSNRIGEPQPPLHCQDAPHGRCEPQQASGGARGPVGLCALAGIDSVAAAGDRARRDSIRRWCEQSAVLVARDPSGPLGYSVLEYTFFEQGFVTMLIVAPSARRRSVGTHLLTAAETACTTGKLFTSTNVSNHSMQLLQRAGWRPVGLLHGLDEADPELLHLCPGTRLRSTTGLGG
ncbi:GNAT family N-acetyltransferase [Streptomyces sp. NPDC005017]|uniref:GNAT family N-acetyltransferase n=1 Tax=Streptomyces sp. NPDC005017 TaxID=3364706 RepID=UPI00368DDDCD